MIPSDWLNDSKIQLFFTLLASGLLLLGGEVFVPGGIIGTAGVIALIAAVVVAFTINTTFGFYATVAILILMAITVWMWLKFFPRSRIGKQMTLQADGREFKAVETNLDALQDKEGVTHCELRPAGFALIEGHKVDVISEGGHVPKNTRIRVIRIEGNRIIVREIK